MIDTNNQQTQDDLQALEDLKKSVQDEQQELDTIVGDAADQVKAQTADDLAQVDQAAEELDGLQKQAEEQEQAGAVDQAKQDVASA